MSPSLRAIRWRLILTSVLALVMSLGAFYLNGWAYAPSDDQCTWEVQDQRVLIREILPNGVAEDAGLLEGDELLLIHGRRVEGGKLAHARRFINDQPQGRILVYTVRREGQTLRLPVRLIKPFQFTALIVLLSGLVAWAVGLLVAISSPSRKIARHFYYMGVLSLLLTLLPSLGLDNLPLAYLMPCILLGGLAAGLAPPLCLHFFLRFPHPFALRGNRRFLAVLYGACLGGGLLLAMKLLLRVLDNPELSRAFLPITRDGGPAMAAACLAPLVFSAGLALFWSGTLKQSPRKRKALLPALFFTTAILVDLLIYHFLLHNSGTSLLFRRESWIFFAPLPLLPLSFAYAIFRHGLFDVRRALFRWVTYFVVLGLTLVAYMGGLALLFAQGSQTLPSVWVGALVGLLALPIGWLLRWLLLTLRRSFRRDLNTSRALILGNLRETRNRFSEKALADTLMASLREAFRPQVLILLPVAGGAIQLPAIQGASEDSFDPAPFQSPPQTLPLAPGLLRNARDNGELVVGLGSDEAPWLNRPGTTFRAHVNALEAQILTLVLVNGEPWAALLLGGKYAELNYGRDDRELLREVAVATGLLIETALLHRRLLDQGRIEQELHTARLIQESLITSEAPCLRGFQTALRLTPALETGGDILWVGRRPSGCHIAAVGDVSGKGLPAALYMSQATALLKFAAGQEGMPFELILPSLDQTLRNLMGPKDFLTLSLLEWDASGTYRLARAGHPPLLRIDGGEDAAAQEIPSRGRGLGLRPFFPGQWEVVEGQLEPGQWLVIYSDGLTEAMNEQGELYGVGRLKEQMRRFWGTGSVAAACEAVFQDVAAFECQNRDDRTLFILARDSV